MNEKLSASEKYAWAFMQENLSEMPLFSITQLSEVACVSTATIVRTLQKKGYQGFSEFKQEIKNETRRKDTFYKDEKIDKDIRRVIVKNEIEVLNTLKQLDIEKIERAVQALSGAKKVYLFARGFSEYVASEMQIKFELAEKNCEMHTDPNIIRLKAKKITRENVVVFVSLNGETAELIESAKILKKNDVTCILITTNEEGTLANVADLVFVGYKSQTSLFPEYEVRSRLSLSIISRILLDAYVIRTG